QLALLARRLRAAGRRVHVTAEPTNSALGGLIRDSLSGNHPRGPEELAALFLADRIAHNADPIRGFGRLLDAGEDVLCDRYDYSSFAYQGAETDLDWVLEMHLRCPAIRRPDLCVFLDLEPAAAVARIWQGRDNLEVFENEAKLAAARARYFHVFELLRARGERICVVDADATEAEVHRRVCAAVEPLLEA
ncbi:MAG: dTMP kinase, partial [Oscillospiraceae bacterium]|nr:dTMP kinase [Oscillospiraceae bacterium]